MDRDIRRLLSLKGVIKISKPYKSTEELINILENERGVITSTDTKHILELEGYYPIINGYKDLFLKQKEPDVYIDNCQFNDIYSLFSMDRELRFLIFRKLIIIEQRIKVAICRIFTKKYQEAEAYLNPESYSDHNVDMRDELIETLKEKKLFNKRYLEHYISKHNEVPLWVLANNLTFGNIKYLYFCLDRKLKIEIAQELSISIVKPYSKRKMFYKELNKILIVASYFRNICAHDERLFNEKAIIYDKNHPENTQYFSFMDMYSMILPLLLPHEKKYLINNIKKIITSDFKFSEVSIKTKILNEMGVPKN